MTTHTFRATLDDVYLWGTLAEASGMTLSAWIRDRLSKAAKQERKDRQRRQRECAVCDKSIHPTTRVIANIRASRGRRVTWEEAQKILGLSTRTIRKRLKDSLAFAYPNLAPEKRELKIAGRGHTFELSGYTVTIRRCDAKAMRQIRIVLDGK